MVPCAIFASVMVLFGCMKCAQCRLRDCACLKRFLRFSGHDRFDDFELMMLVHEAMFERKEVKLTTVVRVTAGLHSVRTDPNSNGIFQQPLHITVEQGTDQVVVDLMNMQGATLATLTLDVVDQILASKSHR